MLITPPNALGTTRSDYGSTGSAGIAAVQDVPEPATMLRLPLGLAALAGARLRRQA